MAEISQAAGLSHGGFFRHFPSKEAPVGASVERTLMETAERAAEIVAEDGLDAFPQIYLSPAHLDDRAAGCAIATLCSDLARQRGEVRPAYARGVRAYADALAPRRSGSCCKPKAACRADRGRRYRKRACG